MQLFQYPLTTTVGLAPNSVDIMAYSDSGEAAPVAGQVRMFDLGLSGADATTLNEGVANSGWAVLIIPDSANAGCQYGLFAILLESGLAGAKVKVRVKGRVRAFVDNSEAGSLDKGAPGPCFPLSTATYLTCDTSLPATGLLDNFKAVAILLEDVLEDATSALVEVLFDGLTGFGAFAA
jgi:hypothetical protein